MNKVTITLPATVLIRTIDGEAFNVDTTKLPANVVAELVVGGIKIIGNNTYNSGGKEAAPADRKANLERRVAGWYRGDFVTVGGPRDSIVGDMREAFIAARVRDGMTVKDAEALISSTVKDTFGKDEKATFPRYLDAVATQLAKARKADYQPIRDEIEAKAVAAAEAVREARKAAEAEADPIDLSDLF